MFKTFRNYCLIFLASTASVNMNAGGQTLTMEQMAVKCWHLAETFKGNLITYCANPNNPGLKNVEIGVPYQMHDGSWRDLSSEDLKNGIKMLRDLNQTSPEVLQSLAKADEALVQVDVLLQQISERS